MFRSAVLVLVGLMSITASVEGWMDILKQGFGGIENVMTVIAPCPRGSDVSDHTYHCTGKPPFSLTHCCSLGEWLLSDGLLPMCLTILGILVVVAVIMSIFLCECCSWCPGNRHRTRLVRPKIYQDPSAVHVQQHFSGNYGTRPAGYQGYLPQRHCYEQK